MRVRISDRYSKQLQALSEDLEVPVNQVVNLILRQYLSSFEVHMNSGSATAETPILTELESNTATPLLENTHLEMIDFGEF